ncbi:MAG TPA: LamG domain-containing protein, partial [Candidatus Cybelea sp.]|nr:LamG domain-containing protein [Candidatus Cybelea sp.]
MKLMHYSLWDRISGSKRTLTAAVCLFSAILTSSATVTVQGWWHYGEGTDYYADSSGNGHRFAMAFSRVGSGNAGAGVEPFGCGGPLGTTGFTSTSSLFWTPTHADAAGMWDPGYNPPPTNYVIELWCLPNYPGSLGGNGSWLFCSGSSGGVTFVLTNDGAGNMALTAQIVPLSSGVEIGDPWVVDTNRWTHLAVVNDNGTNTFYVNGVPHGAPTDPGLNTVPAGDIYGGSAPGTQPTYEGYLDELRISTFVEGQFTTNDFLTRPMSPDITLQPQLTT